MSAHEELLEALALYSNDPYGYVLYAYPWGEPGELEDYAGPEEWQRDLLIEIGLGVISVEEAIAHALARNEAAESVADSATQPLRATALERAPWSRGSSIGLSPRWRTPRESSRRTPRTS